MNGTSNEGFTPMMAVSKKPLFQETGGKVVTQSNSRAYMNNMEMDLERALRKQGVQISRVGSDIVVVIVRSAIIYTDSPEISEMGNDLLGDLVGVLKKYESTWIEIVGYTDSQQNQSQAIALSRDMAARVAVYFAQHQIQPLRMFIDGRGSANPIADQSDIGRLTNLRVEIRLSAID